MKQCLKTYDGILFSLFIHPDLQVQLSAARCLFSVNADTTSSGPPKPVITNHGTYAIVDNDRKLPIVKGRKNQSWALFDFEGSGGRYFTAVPPFHVSLISFVETRKAET